MTRRNLNRSVSLIAVALLAVSASACATAARRNVQVYDVTLTPNYLSPLDDRAANHQGVWIYPKSPTTPYRSPDSLHQISRYLLLDPRYKDADGRPGKDEWWFVIQRYWPSSYPAANHGDWGGEVNFHNVAGDAGPGAGIGWGFGSGVSSLSLSWGPGDPAPMFTVEPNSPHNAFPLPHVSRDTWHTYLVHWIAGRTDGTTPRPGALTVWADGAHNPVIDKHQIDTVQRAKGPDGRDYTQRWMQLWEGDYTRGLQTISTVRLALTRIGNTLPQALADHPIAIGTNVNGQYYSGNGANRGAPSVKLVGKIPADAAAIPRSLHELG